jgi:IclR family transcriptional regulator, acetate operon repressor
MPAPTQPVQSVTRALSVLEALGDAAGQGKADVGVIELGRLTGLSAATTHRLLATLLDGGYVTRGEGEARYRLGTRLFALAASAESPLASIREQVAPAMEHLRDRYGETVNLAVLERRHIVYVHQVESQRSVRAFNRIGNRVLAHASAAGKALLAFGPESALDVLLASGELEQLTPATVTMSEDLRRQLAQIRERGYALDLGEQDPEIICVAAPVPTNGWRPTAALSISGPADRMRRLDPREVGAGIIQTLGPAL